MFAIAVLADEKDGSQVDERQLSVSETGGIVGRRWRRSATSLEYIGIAYLSLIQA